MFRRQFQKGSPKIFDTMTEIVQVGPVATLGLSEKEENTEKIEKFIQQL